MAARAELLNFRKLVHWNNAHSLTDHNYTQ